ncbi:hypothetical protein AGMMS49975_01920 [Clostridia bacterium]|nr:hypothetical protein AGMMS49975_01920 [Clostridia bacterium]
MFKMIRYLKKYRIHILFIVIFLFLQAICELTLPMYMSNIVDVGLTQGGVKNYAPEALRKDTYDGLSKDLAVFYTQAPVGTVSAKYPLNASEPVYVLNAKNPALSELFGDYWGDSIPRVQEEYKALGVDLAKYQTRYLFLSGLEMLGIALLSAGCVIVSAYLAARTAAGSCNTIRSDLFRRVISFSGQNLDRYPSSTLITRCTNDVQSVQQSLMLLLRMVLFAPIMGIGGIVMVVRSESGLAWIVAVSVLSLLGIIFGFFSVIMPKFNKVQKLVDKVNLKMREALTGILVVRAFGTQKREEERFDKTNTELTELNLDIGRLMMGAMMPLMMFVMNITTVVILYFGAPEVGGGNMLIGNLMAFIQYAGIILFSFMMISMVSIMIARSIVSLQRIHEVLEEEFAVLDPENSVTPNLERCKVEFDNVSFKYPGSEEYALEGITFTAEPGEVTAFIGSTGSGKSSIVSLIPRFYDADSGAVKINSVNVKDMTQKTLRSAIGYVPQKSLLFSGTIESNLKYSKEDMPDENMKRAARIASATFIEEKPEKYAEEIAEGGVNVSGGQRQRLSIARAIAANTPVYIFDESFSALDFKTEATVKKAIREELADATILIVASRISTIRSANKIIVLDDGQIVGSGTHDELLKSCEVYSQIASSQLSPDEL